MTEERKKEKSRGFAAFGIPVGSTLVYKKDPAVTVKTLDDRNKVAYQGKPYSISTLAKQLVGSPVSGYLYFKYGDKVIKFLGKPEAIPAPASSAMVSAVSSNPAESAGALPVEEDAAERNLDPLAGMEEVDSAESTESDAEEETE